MSMEIYLLGNVLVMLGCMYWARANDQPVELWGIAALVASPLALLVLAVLAAQRSRRPPRARPAPVVRAPAPSGLTYSAAAGPVGGYSVPGEEVSPSPKQMPWYLPLVLNVACLLVLLALSWGNEGDFLLLAVPLVIIGNGLLFLRAFAKRADGPALLFLLPVVGALWLVAQVLDGLGHR